MPSKIVIICEHHEDTATFNLLLEHKEDLKKLGLLNNFALELPEDKSIYNIIEESAKLWQYQIYLLQNPTKITAAAWEEASIKQTFFELESTKMLAYFLKKIQKDKIPYRGLDKKYQSDPTLSRDENLFNQVSRKKMSSRNEVIVKNLLAMQKSGGGIAVIGYAHIQGIQEELIKQLGNEAVTQFLFIIPAATPKNSYCKVTYFTDQKIIKVAVKGVKDNYIQWYSPNTVVLHKPDSQETKLSIAVQFQQTILKFCDADPSFLFHRQTLELDPEAEKYIQISNNLASNTSYLSSKTSQNKATAQPAFSPFLKGISFFGGLAGFAIGGPLYAAAGFFGGVVAAKTSEKLAKDCCTRKTKIS